jgi:hypothetical protein
MPYDKDPLTRVLRSLASVLIAVLLSVLIAALIGGALPFEYEGRAWAYTALVVYVIAGAVVVFIAAGAGERGEFSAARVLKWTASLWLWPLLLLARRKS